jgi:hypothetical protein
MPRKKAADALSPPRRRGRLLGLSGADQALSQARAEIQRLCREVSALYGLLEVAAGASPNKREQLTLHEAMALVLAHSKASRLKASELATGVNRLRLYRRDDGRPVPSSQISARASNYPHLFAKGEGGISLVKATS